MTIPRPTRPYGADRPDGTARPDRAEPRATSATIPTSTVSAGGLDVHHVDAGPRDAPAVLLLPGLIATHRYYRRNIATLAERYRVLAPDLPGFGLSAQPDAPYTPGWFVEQVLAFLDVKGIARAHVVGNSLGGQIAMALALAHPARVDRLVLVSPAGLVPWSPLVTGLLKLVEKAAAPSVGLARLPRIPTPALSLLFRAAFPTRPDIASSYTRGYAAAVASPHYPLYARAAIRAARGSVAMPMKQRAMDIEAATLIVWGARDLIHPVSASKVLTRAMPGAELLVYPEAGHCPMIDEAERWNRDILRFLDDTTVAARV